MKSLLVLPGLLLLCAASAQAQTADQYNRASQALQICGSATGAMIPECAQLRGRMGMSVVAPQDAAAALGSMGLRGGGSPIGGFGSLGGAGKAAGIAGLLGQAISAARSQQAAAPAGQAMLPSDARSQSAAMAAYAAGQSYQACVAANPNNWQACVQAMNGGAPVGPPSAGVSAQRDLVSGGHVPPDHGATPASNPFGALLPKR